jgi:hypothetical protein
MGKKRSIDSKIRASQSFAKLTYCQRDLWQGIIATADDQGRMPGVATYVRSEVWPFDDINLSQVEEALQAIEQAGYIVRYIVDDMVYLQIVNWWKYQPMQWAGPSDYPASPGWMDRLRYHGKGNEIIVENWDTPGGYLLDVGSQLPREQPSKLSRRDVNGEGEGDVNDDGEGDGDGEASNDNQPSLFRILFDAFIEASGIQESTMNVHTAVDEINKKWIPAGVTVEEVKAAVEEMQAKEFSMVGPKSITNSINIVRSKNNGKVKKLRNTKEARRKYAEWDSQS